MKYFIKILLAQYFEEKIDIEQYPNLEDVAFKFMRKNKVKDLDSFIFMMIESDTLRQDFFTQIKKHLKIQKNTTKKSAA